jgi:hypothetical protein
MTVMTRLRVPLDDVGGLSAAEAKRFKVGPDDRGEPSLSLDDAALLAQGRQEATEAHEAAWRAHQSDNERWLAERVTAARSAGRMAIRGQRAGADRSATYRRAFIEAMVAWQRKHPRPEWQGRPTLPDGLLATEEDAAGYVASEDDYKWREVH